MLRILTASAILFGVCANADARHRASGSWPGFGGTHEFRTSRCVSGQCFARHPGGMWRHPLTRSRGRSWRS